MQTLLLYRLVFHTFAPPLLYSVAVQSHDSATARVAREGRVLLMTDVIPDHGGQSAVWSYFTEVNEHILLYYTLGSAILALYLLGIGPRPNLTVSHTPIHHVSQL